MAALKIWCDPNQCVCWPLHFISIAREQGNYILRKALLNAGCSPLYSMLHRLVATHHEVQRRSRKYILYLVCLGNSSMADVFAHFYADMQQNRSAQYKIMHLGRRWPMS